jgi:hypothetical protein
MADTGRRARLGGSTLLWLSLALLAAAIGVARVSSMAMDDDNIWLAYAAIPPSSEAKALEQALLAYVASIQECFSSAYRLALRERYTGNYAGYLAVINLVYSAVRAVGSDGILGLVSAFAAAKLVVYGAFIGLILWAAARIRDAELNSAVALGFAALAAADILAHSGLIPIFWIVELTSPVEALPKIAYSFILSSEAHSLFGLTPRNAALALFAAAMVLRWRGMPFSASVAILLTGIMHQTYGGISLFLFSVLTAVAKPEMLERRPAQLVLVLSAVIYALRERYFVAGLGLQVLLVAALVLTAAIAFAVVKSDGYRNLRRKLLGRAVDQEIIVDAAMSLAVCSCVTLIALAAAQNADPVTAFYFWADLVMRIWSFARFPVFVAGALVLIRLVRTWSVRPQPFIAALALLLTGAALTQMTNIPVGRGAKDIADVIAGESRSPGLRLPADEAAVYAHLTLVSIGHESFDEVRRQFAQPVTCSAQVNPGKN